MTAESVRTQPDDGLTELASRLRLVVGRLNRRIRIDGHETIPPLQLWTGTVAVTQTNDGASITYKSLADTHDGLAPTSYRLEVTTEESPLHNSW